MQAGKSSDFPELSAFNAGYVKVAAPDCPDVTPTTDAVIIKVATITTRKCEIISEKYHGAISG